MKIARTVTVAGIAGVAALATAALGQQPATNAGGAGSVQQQFDAATLLSQGADASAALAAWQALVARTARNPRSHAIMLVRESGALFRLNRDEEALAAAKAGLTGLPAGDRTLDDDRYDALLTIGQVDRGTLDYAGAADAFAKAVEFAGSAGDRLSADLGYAQVAIFTDPVGAQAALARADASVAANKVSPQVAAVIQQQHALLMLNRGDAAGAVGPAKAAVATLGGLTSKTDLRDVSARSTASLALLLSGEKDTARQYMAMTGAGRVTKGSFDPAVQMQVPDCGGEGGLKPDDVAVIEFSIDDDGTVSRVTPIYAAGGGQVALEFARAARGWSWTPEQAKGLPIFFRNNTRVEMRCSTGFERPGVGQLMAEDLSRWLEGKGVELPEPGQASDAANVAGQRAALARAEASDPIGLPTLAALWVLCSNAVVGREESHEFARRALAIAVARGAPPMARLAIDVTVRRTDKVSGRDSDARALRPLLTDPAYSADPQARAAARLMLAEALGGRKDDGRVLLRQVADDRALASDDRFRVGALVRLASLEQQGGDAEAARAAFAKTGLAANQCAIIDASPKMLKVGGTFPQEAFVWGFEGWTQTQYDVTADGRVVHERAILSYPPFVFSEAGRKTMADARFAKSFRPAGELGCSANTGRVRFQLPH